MEAKELRIGNIVYSKLDSANLSVYQIDALGCLLENNNGCRWIELHDILPIRPTEEILLRCGFKKVGKLNYKYNDFKITIFGGEFCFYTYHYKIIIESIHQLQNLYFSLTTKELEINL